MLGYPNYPTGDQDTAEGNFHFLRGFFRQFTQFQTNDFYIAG
jgi:hypothetical protein